MFLSRYNILGAVALGKAKNEKAAAKILFDIVGLETEKYRLGHTKVWKIFEFWIQSSFYILHMKYLFSTYLEYVVALNLLISPFRKINYRIYSVAKWFRVHFKNVEGFGHWHYDYTQPGAFFPFFVWCHVIWPFHILPLFCTEYDVNT